jgi:hypothetical protein
MLKAPLIASAVTLFLLSPAFGAKGSLCNDAHMKQMDSMIAEMTDEAKKKEAVAHLDQSKAEMKKGNDGGCMEHMEAAHQAMGL